MKIEKILTYGIPIALGIGALYMLSKQTQPTVKAVEVAEPKLGVQGKLLELASKQLGIPASELIVRGLRPQDLGLTTFDVTAGGAGWTTMVNATVPDNTFISFDGCSFAGTNFTQLEIQAGAKYVEYWPLVFIRGLVSQLWYDDSPSVAEQNQPVIIRAYAKAAGTETISIMGTVVERRGMVVNP